MRGLRGGTFSWPKGLILLALFASYFFQNLFVFDNLNTYLLFFAFLAYTQFLAAPAGAGAVESGSVALARGHPLSARRADAWPPKQKLLALAAPLLIGAAFFIYFGSVKPIQASKALIRAIRLPQLVQNPSELVEKLIQEFRQALSYRSFGDTEIHEQIANLARSIVGNPAFSADDQKKYALFAIEEFRKEIERPGKDVKHLVFLAATMDRSIQFEPKFAGDAEGLLREALQLSPTKQLIYFELAQLYFITNQLDRAVKVLREAWLLEPDFIQARVNLWLAAVLAKNREAEDEARAGFDPRLLEENDVFRLALAYQRVEDFRNAAEFYELLVKIAPQNARYHATFAALLAQMGSKVEARVHAEEAARLDPNFENELKPFLESLKK